MDSVLFSGKNKNILSSYYIPFYRNHQVLEYFFKNKEKEFNFANLIII